MKTSTTCPLHPLTVAVLAVGCLFPPSSAGAAEIFGGTLRNGDYGTGKRIDTMDPNHGASPHVLGIVDSADGVTFTSTESDGRSNGLISWQPGAARPAFQTHGAVRVTILADKARHVAGELWGDNFGFDGFMHGQGAFSSFANRISTGAGPDDLVLRITWKAWHNDVWYYFGGPDLEYDRAHTLGFTWGGPNHDYELWVDGVLVNVFELPAGVAFPWGHDWGSGTNWGLGGTHQRGYNAYGSVAGITCSDLTAWDEYRPGGGTHTTPENFRLVISRTGAGASSTTMLRWGYLGDNYRYTVEQCGDLDQQVWTPATGGPTWPTTATEWVQPVAPSPSTLFYRVSATAVAE